MTAIRGAGARFADRGRGALGYAGRMSPAALYGMLAVALGHPAPTRAGDGAPDEAAMPSATTPAPARRHAAYLELLGKGGLWGIGYDYLAWPRLALGATASYAVVGGEHVATLSPYAALYPAGGRRHRWLVQLGPQIVHLARPSPVPEWPGQSSTGVGGQLGTGYELRTRLLVRAFAMVTVGEGGLAPWLGVSGPPRSATSIHGAVGPSSVAHPTAASASTMARLTAWRRC